MHAMTATQIRALIYSSGVLASLYLGTTIAAAESQVRFKQNDGALEIFVNDRQVATYIYHNDLILRPFFANVRALDGTLITRAFPPREPADSIDHADQHPGIWFAVSDVNGVDFWRNKGRVEHEKFVIPPEGNVGYGTFQVVDVYRTSNSPRPLCRQVCRYTLAVDGEALLLSCEYVLTPTGGELTIGDAEEMGYGVRLADALSVKRGGQIIEANGRRNEREIWGKQPAWCDYSKRSGDKRVGVTVMTDPQNFRPSWFHVRDYGLMVANPFATRTFTGKPGPPVVIKPGTNLQMRYAAYIYSQAASRVNPGAAYEHYVKLIEREKKLRKK